MKLSPVHVADALRADGIPVVEGPSAPIARPRDEAQVVRALRRATADRLRVLPAGLGSKLDWCRPEHRAHSPDFILSTADLNQVVAYVPGDGTLTAQAGCRMGDLEQHVGQHGHYLTPALPHAAGATLGGTLAAGVSGADRIRFGPTRHHVLGMRVALADGTLCNSGGRLVKNVTGFDLHRLYTGSRGTLCVQLEASLRLFPQPEAFEIWRAEADRAGPLLEAAAGLARLPIRPFEVTLASDRTRQRWSLDVHVGGRPRQLAEERELTQQVFQGVGRTLFENEEARARRAERGGHSPDAPNLRITCLPSKLARALRVLESALPDPFAVTAEPFVAQLDVHLEPSALEPSDLFALARELEQVGAQVEARALPPEYHERLALRVDEHPALHWMFRLADRFDPQGVLASPLFPGIRTQ